MPHSGSPGVVKMKQLAQALMVCIKDDMLGRFCRKLQLVVREHEKRFWLVAKHSFNIGLNIVAILLYHEGTTS